MKSDFYYQGIRKLEDNQFIEALDYFNKHKPINDIAKPIIKYAVSQNLDIQEYAARWLLQRIRDPQYRVDCLNILGCSLKKKNQDSLKYFLEAEQLMNKYGLRKGPTLINLTHTYSMLKQHEKALQYALQSLTQTQGKQKIIALHNVAVEYKYNNNQEMSQQFNNEAYQFSKELLGDYDELTLKMQQYCKPIIKKQRSSSIKIQKSRTFYFQRQRTSSKISHVNNQSSNYLNSQQNVSEVSQNQSEDQDQNSFIIHQQNKLFQEEKDYIIIENIVDEKKSDRIQFLLKIQDSLFSPNKPLTNFNESQVKIANETQRVNESQSSLLEILNKNENQKKEENNDFTGMSFAKDETFENTMEQQNQNVRAARLIQNWYRYKRKQQVNEQPKVYTQKQLRLAAIKIQQKYRQYQAKEQFEIKSIKRNKYCRVVTKDLGVVTINLLNGDEQFEIIVCKKKSWNYKLNLTINQVTLMYQNFDEFCQINQISNQQKMNKIAYQIKQKFNLSKLIDLLYIHKKILHLYGVTDTKTDLSQSILSVKKSVPIMNMDAIQKLQSKVRGKLIRAQYECQINQIKKSKRFITKIDNQYYYIIQKQQNLIQIYDISNKKLSINILQIPDIIIKFYGQISRDNCVDILKFQNDYIVFQDDAQYLIERNLIKQQKFDKKIFISSAIKIQRMFKSQSLRNYIDILIAKRKQLKGRREIFCIRRSFIYEQHSGILSAIAKIENQQQNLLIGGICFGENPLFIKQSKQRLFFPLDQNELMQVSKMILNQIQIQIIDDEILLQPRSIEDVQGELHSRGQKKSMNREPTLPGRNYFSRNVLSRQYIMNQITVLDSQPISNPIYDRRFYQIMLVKSAFRQIMQIKKQNVLSQKSQNNVSQYINSFQGQTLHIEPIVDPDLILQEKLERNASMIQRNYRIYKFLKYLEKKVEQAKARKPKPKPKVIKEYYFDLIQHTSPFCTKQILAKNGYQFIELKTKIVEDQPMEWLLVFPFQDIIATHYRNPREFYQIKYQEYTNFHLDRLLMSSIEQIQKYFSNPIEQFHPKQKDKLIAELREQHTRKVIKRIKLILIRNRLKEIPNFEMQLIRQFINPQYIKISYFYLKNKQKFRLGLFKENYKRIYEFDYFYVDQFYNKFHEKTQTYLHRDDFLKILTLYESKNFNLYRQLLIGIVNVINSYCEINSNLDLSFHPYEIPVVELVKDSESKRISYNNKKIQDTSLRELQLIVWVQNKWRRKMQEIIYDQSKQFYKKLKQKLLTKKGKLIQRSYLKLSEINESYSQNGQEDRMFLVLIYMIQKRHHTQIRIELHNRHPYQYIFNIFTYNKTSLSFNVLNIIQYIKLEQNQIKLQYDFDTQLEETEREIKLIVKKPSTPKLIYQQKRVYGNGQQFLYDTIHTGQQPIQIEDESNLIKIDVDLHEFKSKYPQVDYTRQDVLPSISEQIVQSVRMKNNQLIGRNLLKQSQIKCKGQVQADEKESIQIIETKQEKKVLERFTQFYMKQRYIIQIMLENIPIEPITGIQQDSIYSLYESRLLVQSLNLNKGRTGESVEWYMSLQEAKKLTNRKTPELQAQYIKQYMQALPNKILFVARHQIIEFQNVLMIPYKSMVNIQRLIKNRKFKINHKKYDQEIKQIKDKGGNIWKKIILHKIEQFHTNNHFIVIVIDKKQYQLIAWDILTYDRFTMTIYDKTQSIQNIIDKIHFVNGQLILDK